jgi:hypothetical protein
MCVVITTSTDWFTGFFSLHLKQWMLAFYIRDPILSSFKPIAPDLFFNLIEEAKVFRSNSFFSISANSAAQIHGREIPYFPLQYICHINFI